MILHLLTWQRRALKNWTRGGGGTAEPDMHTDRLGLGPSMSCDDDDGERRDVRELQHHLQAQLQSAMNQLISHNTILLYDVGV